jgi:DNA-binding LacI/PurR family transcriptional regulator
MNLVITIKDIAKLARVSQSTVSKVLNDRPDVGQETRQRVLGIVKEQRFVPNIAGKSLKKKNTGNIGVIFRREQNPLSTNPFYSRVLEGIEAETALNNYNLVLHMVAENQEPTVPKMVRERHVDGAILVGMQSTRFVERLLQAEFPLVLVDPKNLFTDCVQILIDNENGAFLATKHLIEAGHRRIGFVSGELTRLSFQQRLSGYRKALQFHQIEVEDVLIQSGGVEAGYELTKRLLSSPKPPSAIVFVNDINAIFGYHAADELGFDIPEDLSIVGFDDIDMAGMATPPLTTIRVYKEELGSVAVRYLRQLLTDGATVNSTTIIPVRLVERQSVKKLPQK